MVTADASPVTVESKQAWFEKHSERNPLLVIKVDDEVIGWISFQPFYDRPAYDATAEISIYLDKSAQGKGIGKKVLQYAIENCSKLGIKTLLGFIFSHNEPSLKLFKSFNFEEWGNLPKVAELDDIERNVVILGRRVTV